MTTNRKASFKTVSDFIDLGYFQLICQMQAAFSGVKSERPVFKFRKSKKKKKCVVFTQLIKRTREIRKFHVVIVLRRLRKVLALLPKLIAFLPLLLPSPSSLLKVPIVLIQKLCYHGNMTSRFSLFCNTFGKTNHSIHIRSNGLTRLGLFPVSLSSCMICPKKMQQRGHFRDNFLLS